MATRPVRIKLGGKASRTRPVSIARLVARFPMIAQAAVAGVQKVPQSRLRRALVAFGTRQMMASYTPEFLDSQAALSAPDVQFLADPDLAAVLGQDSVLDGIEATKAFLTAWHEPWDDFRVVPAEVIDLGDGRFLVLNRLYGRGATSGIELAGDEEAELVQWRGGQVVRIQQWRAWAPALEAVGLGGWEGTASTPTT